MAEDETKPTTDSMPSPAETDSNGRRGALSALFGTREASIAFVALMVLCILTIAAFAALLGPVQAEGASAELKPGYLMLLIVTGALGGCLHAIHSLTTRVGAGTFDGRWFSWYLSRPLVGAGLALCFLPLVRAGFFTVDKSAPAGGDLPADTAFYLQIAIAVVVGMFSTHAINKLYDIVRVLLATSQTAADAAREQPAAKPPAAPVVLSLVPDTVVAGSADLSLAITTSAAVADPVVVAVNGTDLPTTRTGDTGLSVTVPAAALAQAGALPVTVRSGSGPQAETSPAAMLTVTRA